MTGIYLFAILPRINDFEMLVLALAPAFLVVGAFIPRTELSLITMLLAANIAGDLGLQGRYSADFVSYANGGMAITGGILFSLIWTLVTRPFGAEIAARRLVRNGWADLAGLAAGSHLHDHATLVSRTLDRLGQLMARLASDETHALRSIDGLAELRIGYNIIALQRDRRALPGGVKSRIDAVLGGVSSLFRHYADLGKKDPAPGSLLQDIDKALRIILDSQQGHAAGNALDALVGLRRALFPDAPGPIDKDPLPASRYAFPNMPIAAE